MTLPSCVYGDEPPPPKIGDSSQAVARVHSGRIIVVPWDPPEGRRELFKLHGDAVVRGGGRVVGDVTSCNDDVVLATVTRGTQHGRQVRL